MRLLIACPPNLLRTVHIENALSQSQVEPTEILLPSSLRGTADHWIKDWAKSKSLGVLEYADTDAALQMLLKEEAAVVAVASPDHPDTLDLVSKAESRRIPVYIYRELYRQDPRINCRFSPVERPDVWLKALTAEQRDFFRRLQSLCKQYNVELHSTGETGSLFQFGDGSQFESIELDDDACRVRPRGAFRYRKIPLD